MKLEVRNNWENYEWSFGGVKIDAQNIETVVIDSWDYNARAVKKYNTVNDMGHRYDTTTFDIEIESDVADVSVWMGLYKNPKLLSKVTAISMTGDE